MILLVNIRAFFFQVCSYHLATPGDAPQHYKAVCRALVTEAQELITFLDSISKEKAVGVGHPGALVLAILLRDFCTLGGTASANSCMTMFVGHLQCKTVRMISARGCQRPILP